MIGYVYNKRLHKNMPIVQDEATTRGLRFLLMKQAAEKDAQDRRDHRNGYCPHCHLLIPTGRTTCECQE